MTDSTIPTIEHVSVIDISLDPDNVRLRGVEPYEADILDYLYQFENVYDLAREIALTGLFAHDLPIVTRENGKLVVLEGNRRVAALRGIANPTCVPRYAQKLAELRQSMSQESLDALQTINVSVAPSRESAQPTIASIHTRTPKKSWPLDQQAKFFHAQLEPGRTVEDLQRDYPTIAANIPASIRMGEMYELVKAADLGSRELHEFVESKNFKLSIFERLYQSQTFQELLGIAFEGNGLLKAGYDQSRVNRILTRVVQDMSTGFLTTRRLGKQEQPEFVRYLKELEQLANVSDATTASSSGKDKATESNAGERDSTASTANTDRGSDETGEATNSTQSTNSQAQTSIKPQRRPSNLDSRGVEFNLHSMGTERRYNELITMNFQRFPNATMDQIRSVLECALKAYFAAIGNPIPRRPNNAPIMLADGLAHAHRHFSGDRTLEAVISRLKATGLIDEQQYTRSALALNAANHNPEVVFNANDVQDAWTNVRPLIKVLVERSVIESSES